jgi:hypothetical protein
MKSRALKFKLLCGLEGCIPLDPTDLTEIQSAEQFITLVDKFRTGIRRFNDRNPPIVWSRSPSLREDTTLNDIIHEIVNSRKFMNFPNVNPNDYEQVFELNFATETITLYQADIIANPLHELGTMHINTMFSNWKELFYSGVEDDSWVDKMEYVEDEDEVEIINEEESLYAYMKPKMLDQLNDTQMELWDLLISNAAKTSIPEKCIFKVNYSGSGDSGDIDSFNVYYDGEDSIYIQEDINKHFDVDTVNSLFSHAWRVIDEEEPGFVNNDGGYGEIEISATKFSWNHYNYYTETNQTIEMDVNLEEKGVEIVDELPSELEEAMEATTPESKSDITLLDIVKEHHPEKFGSDYDIDKTSFFDYSK